MAVIVLGAGATRGASFVREGHGANPCLPPLDADFFVQLQRLSNSKHQPLINAVIADTVDLFGVNFRLTLETVFTTLEHTLRMVGTTGETRDFNEDSLWERQDRLVQAIAATLEESMTLGRNRQTCEYHDELVDKLRPGDTLVSYNYDCLLDDTLKRRGDNKWNPRYGYGFPLGGRGTNLVGDKHWAPRFPAAKGAGTINLFKLHGSLHFWVTEKQKVYLKQRPYTKQKGDLRFTIIPPAWNKHYDEGCFQAAVAQSRRGDPQS